MFPLWVCTSVLYTCNFVHMCSLLSPAFEKYLNNGEFLNLNSVNFIPEFVICFERFQ